MSFKKGLENVIHNPETNQRIRQSLRKAHENKEFGFKKGNKTKSQITKEDWKNKMFAKKHLHINSPNRLEIVLDKIIQEIKPFSYKFTGNGSVSIDGKVPDFLYSEKKKIIELYGENWHSDIQAFERVEHFRRNGYNTLIVWSKELKNIEVLKLKIRDFTNNFFSVPVQLSEKAYLKLKYYVTQAEGEISGFGYLKQINSCFFQITDFEIYPQTCSIVSSVLDGDSFAKILCQKMKDDKNISNLKVWFHSHSNSSCFWSHIDERTIRNSHSFLLSLVVNKNMEILGRLDILEPLYISEIPVIIMLPKIIHKDIELKRQCQKEITEKVKKQSLWPLILKDKKKSSTRKHSKLR